MFNHESSSSFNSNDKDEQEYVFIIQRHSDGMIFIDYHEWTHNVGNACRYATSWVCEKVIVGLEGERSNYEIIRISVN